MTARWHAQPGAAPGGTHAGPDPQRQLDELQAQLRSLGGAVAVAVAGAQQETLDHLLLLEAGVQELEASARLTAQRRSELQSAAKKLAVELRGLDLLERHVQSIAELVQRLEAAVGEVLSSGAAAAAARAAAEAGGL